MKGIKAIALTIITIGIICVGAFIILDYKNRKTVSKKKTNQIDEPTQGEPITGAGVSNKLKEIRKQGKEVFFVSKAKDTKDIKDIDNNARTGFHIDPNHVSKQDKQHVHKQEYERDVGEECHLKEVAPIYIDVGKGEEKKGAREIRAPADQYSLAT